MFYPHIRNYSAILLFVQHHYLLAALSGTKQKEVLRDWLGLHGERKKKKDSTVDHFGVSELLYAEAEGEPLHTNLLRPLWNLCDLTPERRRIDCYPKLSN